MGKQCLLRNKQPRHSVERLMPGVWIGLWWNGSYSLSAGMYPVFLTLHQQPFLGKYYSPHSSLVEIKVPWMRGQSIYLLNWCMRKISNNNIAIAEVIIILEYPLTIYGYEILHIYAFSWKVESHKWERWDLLSTVSLPKWLHGHG